ncbi:hypothetical protein OG592_15785 [Streptomyces avidinii]|uniref:hypothetical protein n=1 Tax=Streptomyces avidinii TaxID=1895 RepID=UPI0038646C5C|nr:hypothetical protein OG592_15785 [Streptomyces avidinii]
MTAPHPCAACGRAVCGGRRAYGVRVARTARPDHDAGRPRAVPLDNPVHPVVEDRTGPRDAPGDRPRPRSAPA